MTDFLSIYVLLTKFPIKMTKRGYPRGYQQHKKTQEFRTIVKVVTIYNDSPPQPTHYASNLNQIEGHRKQFELKRTFFATYFYKKQFHQFRQLL